MESGQLNPDLRPIDFLHSDLFTDVPPAQFDLIVFNFNYYPSDGTFGLNKDSGRDILKRFFDQVHDYITGKTRIYIPYSQFIGDLHDPKNICPRLWFFSNRRRQHQQPRRRTLHLQNHESLRYSYAAWL
jgi:methylase of polypeptide subunit release factors